MPAELPGEGPGPRHALLCALQEESLLQALERGGVGGGPRPDRRARFRAGGCSGPGRGGSGGNRREHGECERQEQDGRRADDGMNDAL